MAGSVIHSGGGGVVRTVSADISAIPPKEQYVNGQSQITVLGAKADGNAPARQVIALRCNNPVTLPVQLIVSTTPFKDGQELVLLNSCPNAITFPPNAFNPGSNAEVLDARQMIQLIYRPAYGWLPMDDDQGDRLPLGWYDGDPTWADNCKLKATALGLALAQKNAKDPTSRLQTTSFAPAAKTVGASYVLTYEDHTVTLTGSTPGTFTLPNPTTCAGRIICLISEVPPITIAITGGGSVRVGGNGTISSIPGGGGLTVQAINGLWRKIGGF